MIRKLILLAIVPVALLAFSRLAANPILMHGWDSVVEYAPPFTDPLPAGKAGQPLTDQVVIVMVDALRDDASRQMPTLNALRARGASLTMTVGQPSLSLPGWSVIGTGAWQERSGVTTNWFTGTVKTDSIFARAKAAGLTTAVVGSAEWKQLYGPYLDATTVITAPANAYTDVEAVGRQDDAALIAALATLNSAKPPSLLLLHFAGPDDAGHGVGGASPVYAQVVQGIDVRLATLLAGLDLTRTTLIVTSDHGTRDAGGHGGWEESVLKVPFVAAGKGILPGAYADAEQSDIAPTVAILLGTAIPTHSQGRGLPDMLDMADKARAQRELDVAQGLAGVNALYARKIGAAAPDNKRLLTAQEALARGDNAAAVGAAREFSLETGSQAEAARQARLASERASRLPLVGLILLPFLLWGIVIVTQRYSIVAPLAGAVVYFAVYNGLFFGGGNQYSLSAFNSEDQIEAFFTRLGTNALLALLAGAVLAGLLSRRKGWFAAAMAGVNTMYLVALGLAAQILLFYWAWNWEFTWTLPDLAWGFKYYLDLLQASVFWPLPYVPAGAIVPLLTTLVAWLAGLRRKPEMPPAAAA